MSKAARGAQEAAAQDQDTENTEEESTNTETTTTTDTTEKKADEAAGEGDTTAEGQEGQQTQADEQAGFEVVEEGADPEAKPDGVIPLSTYRKKIGKWKKRVERARGDAAAKDTELELVRLENEQLKQRLASNEKKPRPKRGDFSDDAAFEAAEEKWLDERIARGQQQRPAPETARPQQQDDEPETDPKLQAHYERAEKLRATDFEQREDEVMETLGQSATRTIIRKFPNSEAVIYALGGNPKKLREVADELKRDPVQAVINLTDYARSLKLKPRTPAPDPDTNENGSTGSITDPQKKLERLRELVSQGKGSMQQVLAFKKECREKGINLI